MFEAQAIAELKKCEQRLRGLLADAASAGDYASLAKLTEWAKGLASMTMGAAAQEAPPAPPTPAGHPKGKSIRPKPKDSAPYPRFFKKGDELVKVGWSKKEKKEYWHKAPRRAVELLMTAAKNAGAHGKMFSADNLLPLVDSKDGATIPDYQAYVALAWLRTIDAVEQVGRQGYRLSKEKLLEAATIDGWAALAEWKG